MSAKDYASQSYALTLEFAKGCFAAGISAAELAIQAEAEKDAGLKFSAYHTDLLALMVGRLELANRGA